jgi:hypothetical protein
MPYFRQCGPRHSPRHFPDGACLLAGRIRRVIQAQRRRRLRDVQVDDTGLHDRNSILGIDFKNAVHLLHLDDNSALGGHRTTA